MQRNPIDTMGFLQISQGYLISSKRIISCCWRTAGAVSAKDGMAGPPAVCATYAGAVAQLNCFKQPFCKFPPPLSDASLPQVTELQPSSFSTARWQCGHIWQIKFNFAAEVRLRNWNILGSKFWLVYFCISQDVHLELKKKWGVVMLWNTPCNERLSILHRDPAHCDAPWRL